MPRGTRKGWVPALPAHTRTPKISSKINDMLEETIDASAFHRRVALFQRHLASSEFGQLLFVVGAPDDEATYRKSVVVQQWLLGFEFTHTAILVTPETCVFVTGESKAKHIRHLATKPTPNSSSVEILVRSKEPEHNKLLFEQFITKFREGSVGTIAKDSFTGKFVDEWAEFKDRLQYADALVFVSECLAQKDEGELADISLAARALVVMMDTFANDMVELVDEQTPTTNADFSDRLDKKIESLRWITRLALGKRLFQSNAEFDYANVEYCYLPIIQSGGEYDLRASALLTEKPFVGEGMILALLGLRYKNYCSNIGRTFMVDPTPDMELNYDFLLELQAHVTTLLVPGAPSQSVYNGAVAYIQQRRPDLVENFTKNVGWLTGLEFRDGTFVLNAKAERTIAPNQVFSLTVGFTNLPGDKPYALVLTDTVKTGFEGATVLTNFQKLRKEVTFYFREDEKVKQENGGRLRLEKNRAIDRNLAQNEANSKILKSKLRNESAGADDANQEKIRQEIQRKLHEKRQQEGMARFSQADATDTSDLRPKFKKYELYLRELQIPSSVRDLRIQTDSKNQTIILPICGRPVPFHINSFKNGLHNEEGEYTYLRLNFNLPGLGGNTSKRTELPYEDNPEHQFVRLITLRLKDHQRMVDVFKAIQDLKKELVKKEAEKKQLADVVSQGKLVEAKGTRMLKLELVFVRPTPDTKKIGGTLQIHENGLRYQLLFRADQRVDVLFSNIKHLFFQPCEQELIVLIHCHLKSPIMIGKRKTLDVQFYREASDIAFDETGGRKRRYRYGDEDELQQEQEERRHKAMLDKEFRSFADAICEALNGVLDLDVPFRELGFQGVPFRLLVFCMPTRDCLVSLVDPPYLVITLEEIEIAHLERVQFGLKNFDMVFVFKDLTRPVMHVNTIPMDELEDIKTWLTDVDIPYSEGQMNLNWGAILKDVMVNPYAFFEDGGWRNLTGDGDSDEAISEDEESEFEASDEDPLDEEVDSAEESEDDFTGSESSAMESEDGEDWDDLEREAEKEDRRRGRD